MCPGPAGVNSFAGTCNHHGECQGCAEGHGGLQCEFCLSGYYGVPTDPQNNGGLCSQCFCNLSPHDCNSTTGYCGNCTGNTSGPTCGECQFGYYGNIDNCMECNCNMTGSHGNCSNDGVCDCLPNVIGVKCTQCAPDSWGFESGLGCTSCDCHPAGTVNGQTQCDLVTGQCQCKNSVSGLKCDMCQPGFWNVDAECIPCDCNKNGTDPATCVDGLCSCDQVTGQCSCALPTIAGRTCDQCGRVNEASSEIAEVFVGPFPKCEPCPECFHRWRAVLNEHITSLDGISALLKGILSNYGNIPLQEVDAQLQTIQEELSSVQLALQEGLVQAGNLAVLQNQYQEVFNEVISVNDSLAAVLASKAALKESVQALGDFDGNVTIVDTADTVTAKLIREGNLQQQATLDDIFLQANASWVRIQQFYTTCVDASARTASLLSEADGLMTEVDRSAQQRRDTLDGLNDEQQLQEREQNDQRIDDIRGIHLSFDLETPVRDVSTAEGLAFTARNISNGTVGAALRRSTKLRNCLAKPVQLAPIPAGSNSWCSHTEQEPVI
ncbi:putative laminin subunit beta-1 isoform X2 [Apostichopus japonicus]|uniref:Putative laminin subunit beta-1 isoform X2 n=1 Tax=Stichopus japonicus TaxID=307972 RepID=A0A2G8KZJ0_STIJA|nr:putative laminin subunit beta-1 isoform X2 [Apostichopus japonicus]